MAAALVVVFVHGDAGIVDVESGDLVVRAVVVELA